MRKIGEGKMMSGWLTRTMSNVVLPITLIFCISAHHAYAASQIAEDEIVRIQVQLDWANTSPGAIDGIMGKNTRTAIKAFQKMRGNTPTGELAASQKAALKRKAPRESIVTYKITEKDFSGPFLKKIPNSVSEKSSLSHLSYTSAQEMLAEKFHMDIDFLKRLNEDKTFAVGESIRVANVKTAPLDVEVDKIIVSKRRQTLEVLGANGQLVAVYPATVGSTAMPSPEGVHEVTSIVEDPNYTYDPDTLEIKDDHRKFILPPGPNNPVGLVWIELSKEGYGIHGSPDPAKIRRQSSHGCVRLTNWDALALARSLKKGTQVRFVE